MKRNIFKFFVIAIMCATAATGCKRKTSLTPLPGMPTTVGNGADDTGNGLKPIPFNPNTAGNGIPRGTSTEIAGGPSTDLTPRGTLFETGIQHPEILAAQTVYFALDSSLIRSSEKSKLSAVVDYLKQNSSSGVIIEGHCDERGTEGYNLALGDRRALALREALIGAGAPAERVQTKTLGETQPADPGHNEAAWSKNRRGVFVVVTPK